MATIPFYATKEDIKDIISHINNEDDLAWLMPDGSGKWIAKRSVDSLQPGGYLIWHIPSGPLPLLEEVERPDSKVYKVIEDPFVGWVELRKNDNPNRPYLGAGHPGVFEFNIYNSVYKNQPDVDNQNLSLHSFGWIGNYWSLLGIKAKDETKKYWQKLRAWVKTQAVLVKRGGPNYIDPRGYKYKVDIYAFKDAQKKFNEGQIANVNP